MKRDLFVVAEMSRRSKRIDLRGSAYVMLLSQARSRGVSIRGNQKAWRISIASGRRRANFPLPRNHSQRTNSVVGVSFQTVEMKRTRSSPPPPEARPTENFDSPGIGSQPAHPQPTTASNTSTVASQPPSSFMPPTSPQLLPAVGATPPRRPISRRRPRRSTAFRPQRTPVGVAAPAPSGTSTMLGPPQGLPRSFHLMPPETSSGYGSGPRVNVDGTAKLDIDARRHQRQNGPRVRRTTFSPLPHDGAALPAATGFGVLHPQPSQAQQLESYGPQADLAPQESRSGQPQSFDAVPAGAAHRVTVEELWEDLMQHIEGLQRRRRQAAGPGAPEWRESSELPDPVSEYFDVERYANE